MPHRTKPRAPAAEQDERMTITLTIDQDTWDLLLEVAEGDDLQAVALKALQAGLEQARTPTLSGLPLNFNPDQ